MKNNKGLTLIEIIITIAIISIMSIAILSIFNISIMNISKSGERTKRVLKVKEKVDEEIIRNKEDTANKDKVKVTIKEIIKDKEVDGKIIEVRDDDIKKLNEKSFNIKITTFVPNKIDSRSP
jgi:prepilin-type N-terminal cleavage/methylation domain-containing protein